MIFAVVLGAGDNLIKVTTLNGVIILQRLSVAKRIDTGIVLAVRKLTTADTAIEHKGLVTGTRGGR